MKKSGSHKWLTVVVGLAVVLALGAVACGSESVDQPGPAEGMGPGQNLQERAGDAGLKDALAERPAAQRRQDAKERREALVERQKALVEKVREEMSAEDQALYDRLKAGVEEQRAQLQDDRQELADTLKELRALIDKYLDLEPTGTN